MVDKLLIAGAAAGLAYFFYSRKDNPEQTEAKTAVRIDKEIDFIADLLDDETWIDDDADLPAIVTDSASQSLDRAAEALKNSLRELINRRRSCSLCAVNLHLENLNEVYAALMAFQFCIPPCLVQGYLFKKKELEDYKISYAIRVAEPKNPINVVNQVIQNVRTSESALRDVRRTAYQTGYAWGFGTLRTGIFAAAQQSLAWEEFRLTITSNISSLELSDSLANEYRQYSRDGFNHGFERRTPVL